MGFTEHTESEVAGQKKSIVGYNYLCHWNKVYGHYCWEQTHFGGVAGLQSLKMKPDSHDVKVLQQQGRKRCSSSAECLLRWVPGREKGLAHEAPLLCSSKWEACRYNFEDYTYLWVWGAKRINLLFSLIVMSWTLVSYYPAIKAPIY